MMSCKEGDPARGVLDFVTSENEGIRHTGSTEEEAEIMEMTFRSRFRFRF